jgi:hypothetical protein
VISKERDKQQFDADPGIFSQADMNGRYFT